MAIIGLNDQTGLSNISTTATAPQHLLKGQSNGYLYQAGSSEEVFKIGVYCGSAYNGDGNGIEIGVYDLGTGPTIDNATKITSGIIGTLTLSAWNTSEITPVALTSGNWYAVGYRVLSATDISLVRTSSGGTNAVNRHATLTGSSALPASWDEGTDFSYRYAVYAETQAASGPTLTDVDTDETIVPGQTGVIATGTNLSDGASARWVDANANVLTMTNYSAHATAPTFDVPNLAAVLAAGVKFGSGDFEIWSA